MAPAGTVTISGILGYLSLAGWLACVGQALHLAFMKSKGDEPVSDHGFAKVHELIEWALRFCFDQGYIVIGARDSDYFIQFRKYIPRLEKGRHGLALSFPDAPWSRAYYPKFRDLLSAESIPFRETRESQGDVTAFIHVDCGQDVDMAVELAQRCFFDIFGLAPDTRFKTNTENYSVLGKEVVDHRGENPSSFEQSWREIRDNFIASRLPDPNLSLRFASYGFGHLLLSYPALWWAWSRAHVVPPDWQFAIGAVHFAGSYATLVLLPIFWILMFEFNRTGRKMARHINFRPGTWIDKVSWPLIEWALPLAVITSWLGM